MASISATSENVVPQSTRYSASLVVLRGGERGLRPAPITVFVTCQRTRKVDVNFPRRFTKRFQCIAQRIPLPAQPRVFVEQPLDVLDYALAVCGAREGIVFQLCQNLAQRRHACFLCVFG